MCKFCNALNDKTQIAAIRRAYGSNEEMRYSVAIITRFFEKGKRGCQGSSTDCRYRGCGYALNFCPECGRRITKNSAIDSPPEKP